MEEEFTIAALIGFVVVVLWKCWSVLAKRVRAERARKEKITELRVLIHRIREAPSLPDVKQAESDVVEFHIRHDHIGTHSDEMRSFYARAHVRAAQDVVRRMRAEKIAYPYLQSGLAEIEMHLRAAKQLDVQIALNIPWSELGRLHRADTLRRLRKLLHDYVIKREVLSVNGDTYSPKDVQLLIEHILAGTSITLKDIHNALDEETWANRELPP